MKKTFQLTSPKIAPARQVEAIKYEIKKYIQREKRKKLEDENTYWGFDCRIGTSEEDMKIIFHNEIRTNIDEFVKSGEKSFHLEILAKILTFKPSEDTKIESHQDEE